MTDIYVALITVSIPSIVTLITHLVSQRTSKMHSAKQSILQMIMEDIIAVEVLHRLPVNRSNIYYEYDHYKKNGGNSDIDKKMQEYEKWYEKLGGKFV